MGSYDWFVRYSTQSHKVVGLHHGTVTRNHESVTKNIAICLYLQVRDVNTLIVSSEGGCTREGQKCLRIDLRAV